MLPGASAKAGVSRRSPARGFTPAQDGASAKNAPRRAQPNRIKFRRRQLSDEAAAAQLSAAIRQLVSYNPRSA